MPFHGERPGGTETTGGGTRWQVSLSGGLQPKWRRDGRELFYVDADNTIVAVPVTTRGARLVLGTPHPLFRVADPVPEAYGEY